MAVRLPAARRRRQLLDVALRLFAEGGYHRTSMDEIAARAGVTKPVLYQHFASKRALYVELLDDVGNNLLDTITKATADAGGPRQQVQAGFTAYFGFVAEQHDAFKLLFGGGPRRDEEFARAVQRVEDAIADAVATMIEADLEPEHRRLLARGLVGMAEATGRTWTHGETEPVIAARRIADLAWAGLRGIGPER